MQARGAAGPTPCAYLQARPRLDRAARKLGRGCRAGAAARRPKPSQPAQRAPACAFSSAPVGWRALKTGQAQARIAPAGVITLPYPTLMPAAAACAARLRAELDIRVVQLHNVVADPAQVVQRVRRLRRLRVALPAHASAGSGHQAALDAQLLSFEHAAFS